MKENEIMNHRNTTKTLTTILLALGFSALCPTPKAFGVLPAPDGAYGLPAYGPWNTAEGEDALLSLTFGAGNTGIGFRALYNNTSGSGNTASGASALSSNTTGIWNTASGYLALWSNTEGSFNTATGYLALVNNITGYGNTASGFYALLGNTTGGNNTASGSYALYSNTDGIGNTASGNLALYSNSTGNNNTASGTGALVTNTTGSSNIALGYQAGQNLTTGDNNIDIGNAGVAGESSTIRIGTLGTQQATYVAGIVGKTVPHSAPVFINSDGKLGTVPSSQRFKTDIKPMDLVSEAILALKPVTFRYKKELDPEGIAQFGLVAEEVEKVNPALVVRDSAGKAYTVRYEAVNAMLLNEFLKEHRKVEQLKKDFESKLAQQQKQIDVLTADLQRTVAVETVGDNVKGAMDGTDRDGKSRHNEWTAKFDGKDFPGSGRVNNQEKEQQL